MHVHFHLGTFQILLQLRPGLLLAPTLLHLIHFHIDPQRDGLEELLGALVVHLSDSVVLLPVLFTISEQLAHLQEDLPFGLDLLFEALDWLHVAVLF